MIDKLNKKNNIENIDNRLSMEEIYLLFCLILSTRSTCKRMKTAAIITSKDLRRIYSLGYNGSVHGFPHKCTKQKGRCGCIHAETNALLKVQVYDPEKIMFSVYSPCQTCAKHIIQSGFSKFYYIEEYRDNKGIDILLKGGVFPIKISINYEKVKEVIKFLSEFFNYYIKNKKN